MRSLVSYSIISYILQIKDRHNGNILIDKEGHVIHIDFGFVLSNSPGSLGFEMAPFKLSQDYIELLGGIHHQQEIGKNKWVEFVELFKIAFKSVRKHAERIITIVELMQSGETIFLFLCFLWEFSFVFKKTNFKELWKRLTLRVCFNFFF